MGSKSSGTPHGYIDSDDLKSLYIDTASEGERERRNNPELLVEPENDNTLIDEDRTLVEQNFIDLRSPRRSSPIAMQRMPVGATPGVRRELFPQQQRREDRERRRSYRDHFNNAGTSGVKKYFNAKWKDDENIRKREDLGKYLVNRSFRSKKAPLLNKTPQELRQEYIQQIHNDSLKQNFGSLRTWLGSGEKKGNPRRVSPKNQTIRRKTKPSPLKTGVNRQLFGVQQRRENREKSQNRKDVLRKIDHKELWAQHKNKSYTGAKLGVKFLEEADAATEADLDPNVLRLLPSRNDSVQEARAQLERLAIEAQNSTIRQATSSRPGPSNKQNKQVSFSMQSGATRYQANPNRLQSTPKSQVGNRSGIGRSVLERTRNFENSHPDWTVIMSEQSKKSLYKKPKDYVRKKGKGNGIKRGPVSMRDVEELVKRGRERSRGAPYSVPNRGRGGYRECYQNNQGGSNILYRGAPVPQSPVIPDMTGYEWQNKTWRFDEGWRNRPGVRRQRAQVRIGNMMSPEKRYMQEDRIMENRSPGSPSREQAKFTLPETRLQKAHEVRSEVPQYDSSDSDSQPETFEELWKKFLAEKTEIFDF